jgi:DNA end-binding protein Ku
MAIPANLRRQVVKRATNCCEDCGLAQTGQEATFHVDHNALTVNRLRFASEIRLVDELRLPVNEKLVPNEVNLALKLIEGMTAEYDPTKYHDTYTAEVKKLTKTKPRARGAKHRRRNPPAAT